MVRMIYRLFAVVVLALAGAQAAFAAGPGVKVLYEDGKTAPQDTPLAFPPHIMVWGLLTFFVLMLIMSRLVYSALLTAIGDRQKRIDDALATAERVNHEAGELLKAHEAKMAAAHAAAKQATDNALGDAQKVRNAEMDRAKAEAAEIVRRAKIEIAGSQKRAVESLKKSAVELGLLASSAVLKRDLKDETSRRVAEEAVARG